MEKQLRAHRHEVEAALLERDKALLRQQQLEKQIESQGGRSRDDLQSLKESYEKIIKAQGDRVQEIEDSLEQSELDRQSLEAGMKSQAERHRR